VGEEGGDHLFYTEGGLLVLTGLSSGRVLGRAGR